MANLESLRQAENKISELKNPFNKDCIQLVTIWICKTWTPQFQSKIKFINGNTTGEQNLEAQDFKSIIKKTEDFIESLK